MYFLPCSSLGFWVFALCFLLGLVKSSRATPLGFSVFALCFLLGLTKYSRATPSKVSWVSFLGGFCSLVLFSPLVEFLFSLVYFSALFLLLLIPRSEKNFCCIILAKTVSLNKSIIFLGYCLEYFVWVQHYRFCGSVVDLSTTTPETGVQARLVTVAKMFKMENDVNVTICLSSSTKILFKNPVWNSLFCH